MVITNTPPLPTATATKQDLLLSLSPQFSEDVLALEQGMQALGYTEVGIVDGVFDQQTVLAVQHCQWLNELPITGEVAQVLYDDILGGNVSLVSQQPPFPAKSLSQFTAGFMPDGFLSGQLVNLGYLDSSDPDFNPFYFNEATDAAVKAFQKNNGLTPNGVVNFTVWGALFNPSAMDVSGQPVIEESSEVDWSTNFYPILDSPIDLAFDGQYIWVLHSSSTDAFDNLLLRIDPQAGLLDQGSPVMIGDLERPDNEIAEMLYDGNRLWFLLPQSFDVPQLVNLIPATAEVYIRSSFGNSGFPGDALGFDGISLWATAHNQVWAIKRTNGQAYLSTEIGWLTRGEMAFDGSCMWMAAEAGLTSFNTVDLTACQGADLAYTMPSGPVAFDGQRVWSTSKLDDNIQWLDTTTGIVGAEITVGNSPSALIFDGTTLWVANSGDDTVQGVDVATGSVGPPLPTGRQPVALTTDGQHLWVANAGDKSLQMIDVSDYQIQIVQPTATPTMPVFGRTLRLTSPTMNGEDVKNIQQALLELGYLEIGTADGSFGPKTEEAVRHFQGNNGLTVDGIVGPLTWDALFSSSAKGP
jgi:peptidoglycan hydrolase-like protein with peptidoglycan-binding domain